MLSTRHLANTCWSEPDLGWIMLSPQTNWSQTNSGANWYHILWRVSVWLFQSAPKCDCCIKTCPNKPHYGGKRTRVPFSRAKQGWCENTHRVSKSLIVLWRGCTSADLNDHFKISVQLRNGDWRPQHKIYIIFIVIKPCALVSNLHSLCCSTYSCFSPWTEEHHGTKVHH